jgi:predicted nuclease of predicted toxin-antitoxin system
MCFLIEAQLPPALARLLNDRGHVYEHVNHVGLGAVAQSRLVALRA